MKMKNKYANFWASQKDPLDNMFLKAKQPSSLYELFEN